MKSINGEHRDTVQKLKYSPDSTKLASGDGDGVIKIWNAQNNYSKLHTLNKHGNDVNDIDFSSDGSLMVSVAKDNYIVIWNTSDFSIKHEKN